MYLGAAVIRNMRIKSSSSSSGNESRFHDRGRLACPEGRRVDDLVPSRHADWSTVLAASLINSVAEPHPMLMNDSVA